MNSDWLKIILDWIEKVVPMVLASFGIGYTWGEKGKQQIQAELDDALMRLQLREDEINNAQYFENKSDSDVIDEVISGKLKP